MQPLCLGSFDKRSKLYACPTKRYGAQSDKRPLVCPLCGFRVPSEPEQAFIHLLQNNDLPEPAWYDCGRGSKWHKGKFDFVWGGARPVFVDIDGGNWQTVCDKRGVSRSGGHANPKRIDSDLRKRNGATVSGAIVLTFTASMIVSQPDMIVEMLREVLNVR